MRLPRVGRWAMRAALTLFALSTFIYSFFAIPARIAMARIGDTQPRRPSLDSVDFIRHRAKFEAEADLLRWIRRNAPPGDRIAEAPAGGYTYGGRVASLAGHPVPLGWEDQRTSMARLG